MREILFKAKRVENGEWLYGVPLVEGYSKTTYIASYEYSSLAFVQQIEVIPETLCQFTGLCDKNGNRIWENDIVNIEYPETTVKKCVIEYVGASFVGSTHADNWELDGYYDIEVIGNIFDNPELLTAERIGEND